MLQSLKNFIMTKRKIILILFLGIVSTFSFTSFANAQTCTSQYNISYYGFESVENSANYETIMENMISYFENQNTYDNYVIMYTTPNSSVQQIKMILFNGRGTIYWSNTTTLRWHSDNQSIQIYTASNIYDNAPSYSTSSNSTYSYVLWGTSYPPTYTNSIVFIDTNTTNFKYDDWDHATCLRSFDNTYTELYGEVTMLTYGYNQIPEITFDSTSYTTSNNSIYKKKIDINFSIVDNSLYDYFVLNSLTNYYEQIIPSTTSYSIDVYENLLLYAEVRDKQGNVLTNASYQVTDIITNANITFTEEKIFDSMGVYIGSEVRIDYFTNNRSDYTYTNFVWYSTDSSPLPMFFVDSTRDYAIVPVAYAGVVYAEILDSNENVIKSASFYVQGIRNYPHISFKQHDNYSYSQYLCTDTIGVYCGRQCVDDVDVFINYGWFDSEKYIYQYSYNNQNWFDVTLTCDTYDFGNSCSIYDLLVSSNSTIFARVLDISNNNDIVAYSSYNLSSVGYCNVGGYDNFNVDINSSTKYFGGPIGHFISIISYFWSHLPLVLQLFFVFLFSLVVILFAFRFLL